MQVLELNQYVTPTQPIIFKQVTNQPKCYTSKPIIFKQVTNQPKRYTYTTYNLQVLELQSVRYLTQPIIFEQITNQSKRYTYTTYNLHASNKSIKTLHLHNL